MQQGREAVNQLSAPVSLAVAAACAAATCSVDARAAPVGQHRGFGFVDLEVLLQKSTGVLNIQISCLPHSLCCRVMTPFFMSLQLHKSAAANGLPGRQLRQASAHAASAGKHRGFGFIEFEGKEDAGDAIDNMNNAELYGRTLRVNYAQPMKIKGGEKGFSHQAVWADSDNWWVL